MILRGIVSYYAIMSIVSVGVLFFLALLLRYNFLLGLLCALGLAVLSVWILTNYKHWSNNSPIKKIVQFRLNGESLVVWRISIIILLVAAVIVALFFR